MPSDKPAAVAGPAGHGATDAGRSGGEPRYSYAIDPDGDATANKVLRWVEPGRRVLELGCGPGTMTRYLRERLDCRVSAVEFAPELAALAEPYCERLLQADLDSLDFAAAFDHRFDVVIAADVLEHLRDPWRCLRAVRPLLESAGMLIVSVPNVAHSAVIAQLLGGRFTYQNSGLLDRTHLRFFTRQDLDDMLLGCGFLPIEWQRSLTAPAQTEFATAWHRVAPALRAALGEAGDGETYQFIVKASPSDAAGWALRAREQAAAADAERVRLQARCEELGADLDEHRKAFAEAREIIAERERALAERAREVDEARRGLDQRDAELERLRGDLGAARAELQTLERQREALQNSRSLRLARGVGRLFGRG